MMKVLIKMIRCFCGKRGSEMVEASIAMPVVILAAMLMIRLFAFYMGIADEGAVRHREVLKSMDEYNGTAFRTYSEEYSREMLSGGLLKTDVRKRISIKAYFINEDVLVRAGEVFD